MICLMAFLSHGYLFQSRTNGTDDLFATKLLRNEDYYGRHQGNSDGSYKGTGF